MAKKLKIFVLVFVVALSLGLLAACAPNEYTLKYAAGEGGGVTGETEQVVKEGEDGSTVTAVADFGYKFVKWSDGVTTAERTDREVSEDITVTAEFEFDNMTVMNHLAEQVAEKMFDFTMAPQDMQEDIFIGGDGYIDSETACWFFVDGWKAISYENEDINLDTIYRWKMEDIDAGLALFKYSSDSDSYKIYIYTDNSNIQGGVSAGCFIINFQCAENFGIEYCDIIQYSEGQNPNYNLSDVAFRFKFAEKLILCGNVNCSQIEIISYLNQYFDDLTLLTDKGIIPVDVSMNFIKSTWYYSVNVGDGYKISLRAGKTEQIIDGINGWLILSGQAPTITCVPDEGYRFVMWSDGVTSPTRTDVKPTDGNTLTLYAIVERIN